MRIRESRIDRRRVVEFYARYECFKKQLVVPELSAWKWTHADSLDAELNRAHLKTGIVAGYLEWEFLEMTLADLRACAIVSGIFPAQPQALAILEKLGCLASWRPDRQTTWHTPICEGQPLRERDAMILRPALSAEHPASWYIEDGSGRAIALLANASRFDPEALVSFAYRGCIPDPASSFMKRSSFDELLTKRSS